MKDESKSGQALENELTMLRKRIAELEAEAATKKSAEALGHLFFTIVDQSVDGIIATDTKFRIIYMNRAAEEMYGYKYEEVKGLTPAIFNAEPDGETIQEKIYATVASGRPVTREIRNIHKDGSIFICRFTVNPMRDQSGDIFGYMGFQHDISELFETRKKLEESEKRYRSVVEHSPAGIFIVNDQFRFIYLNNELCRILGYARDAIIGHDFREFLDKESIDLVKERYQKRQKGENVPSRYELCFIRGDGQKRWGELSSTVFRDAEGIPHTVAQLLDITDRKEAEEALRQSEEKYRLVVENANDAIFIAQDEVVKFPNPRTQSLTGYSTEELFQIPFVNLIVPEDRGLVLDRYRRRLAGEKLPSTYSFRILNKSGRQLWVELSTVFTHWEGREATLNFIRDITQQRNLEEKFQQAQKMEAIGVLAGGIAHNYNNTLMGIQGRVSLLIRDKNSGHSDYQHLKGIEEYVKIAAGLTNDLLGFARGGKYQIKPHNLNAIIQKENRMFEHTKKEVRFHENLAEDLWAVEVDSNQIRQVLMNLYVNAWKAMSGGGEIYLHTENAILEGSGASYFDILPGRYVKVSVIDTGKGMDKATMDKIFDPFFTTDASKTGTGLGLASAYGIIKNHGGAIDVSSEEGKGCTFTIYLPASDKPVLSEEEVSPEIIRGTETILLVDDEEMIIDVGREMLEGLGYNVIVARSGEDAVSIYKENRAGIHAVILDMVMPGMNGKDAFLALREMNPQIKVLLSSGYSVDGEAEALLELGCSGFIQKPFSLNILSQAMRGTLACK